MEPSSPARAADTLVGSDVGKFRVLARIGAGGMGVVYRAEDTSLGRTVALKVLPPDKTADPVRQKRMLREARSLAALDHRGIATVYEVGEAGGVAYIAMELIDGQSLKERLRRGALAAWEAVPIFVAVADALEHAHKNGVVHRDLKPSNVMLTASGGVKLLDFGIAKLLESEPREAEAPTTHEGQVLGTPEYMSPEQARGDRTDHRSDIFSLGSLMYAAVSGRPPFDEETPHETIVAVYRRTPPHLDDVAPEVPSDLRHLVHRCLRKDPDRRYQQAAAVKADLEMLAVDQTMTAATSSAASGPRTAPSAPAARSRRWLLGAAALVGCLALAAVGYWLIRDGGGGASRVGQSEPPAPREAQPEYRERRLTASSPVGAPHGAAISSDGTSVAYATLDAVWVMPTSGGSAQRVDTPALASLGLVHFFPDNLRLLLSGLGAAGRGEAWIVTLAGGEFVQAYSGEPLFDARVSPTGREFLVTGNGWVRVRSFEPGSEHIQIHDDPDSLLVARWSPSGDRIAYVVQPAERDDLAEIWVADRDGSRRMRLTRRDDLYKFGPGGLDWLDDETIGFMTHGTQSVLWALKTSGDAQAVRVHEWSDGVVRMLGRSRGDLLVQRLVFANRTWIASFDRGEGLGSRVDLALYTQESRVHAWVRGQGLVVAEVSNQTAALSAIDPDTGKSRRLSDNALVRPRATATENGVYFWQGAAGNKVALLYQDWATGRRERLREIPVSATPHLSCARARRDYCLLGEMRSGVFEFREVSLAHAASSVRWTLPDPGDRVWSLSPDGTRIGFLARHGRVGVLDLSTLESRAWDVGAGHVLQRLAWADDRGLLVTAAFATGRDLTTMLRTEPDGKSERLWTSDSRSLESIVPSPDGKRVALTETSFRADLWLLEPVSRDDG